mmetsp:Transcript_19298/g.24902  ORF Transcript_19298/g.24902 Transcript_19298/m.24902 type:complete len:123 (+) Transcript_19298:314-682(+)
MPSSISCLANLIIHKGLRDVKLKEEDAESSTRKPSRSRSRSLRDRFSKSSKRSSRRFESSMESECSAISTSSAHSRGKYQGSYEFNMSTSNRRDKCPGAHADKTKFSVIRDDTLRGGSIFPL